MTEEPATAQLAMLGSAIHRSRVAIAEGASVELAGLDAEVARITGIARNAPSEERALVLAAMEGLLCELEGLAADLRRQHDAGLTRQAADAYRAEPETP